MSLSVAHLPMPLSLTGSGITQVVRGLVGAYAARGDQSVVLLSDNRDVEVAGAEVLRVDFSKNCPREYFLPRQYLIDHALAAIGGPRPFMSRFFDPAVNALADRANELDVIMVHEGHHAAASLAGFRRAFPKAVLVYYVHNHLSRSLRRAEVRRRFRDVDAVVAVSDFMAAHVRERLGSESFPIHTVLNGVDPHTYYPPIQPSTERVDTLQLIFVGQVVPHKGLHVLLEAIETLSPAEQRGVSLEVVGGGMTGPSESLTAYERDVRQTAQRLRSGVHFRGWLRPAEVAEALRYADVAVVPSVFAEPFGQVALEAMASGLPVVVSRRGGLPEVVGDAGLVVEPGRLGLADAVRSLIDQGERETRRIKSLKRAADLSWSSRVELLDGATTCG